MPEFIFSNKEGKFPDLDESYIRHFAAKGYTPTGLVIIRKKDGELKLEIKWLNSENIARLGGKEKIKKLIKARIIEKNYDLFVEEDQTFALAI